jgi:hypothetical protein
MNDMADFDFSPQWTAEEQQGFTPLSLDACGLGGTRPADHFAVMVNTRLKDSFTISRNLHWICSAIPTAPLTMRAAPTRRLKTATVLIYH